MDSRSFDEDDRLQSSQHNVQRTSSTAAATDTRCCVICLSDVTEQCEARPCQHADFDFLCLVTWLETRAACPLCKTDVSEVGYGLGGDRKYEKVYKVPERLDGGTAETPRGATSPFDRPRRSRPDRSTRSRPPEDEAIRRRRLIYRHKLYSLYVGSNKRQRAQSMYTELTPHLFASDPRLVSRAKTFLRRELRVFRFLYLENTADSPQHEIHLRRSRVCKAEFLLEYIIAILKTMDMQGSDGKAEDMIQEFIGRDHTRLLLHELRAWLRSPCESLREWDRVVQYRDGGLLRRATPESGERSTNNDDPTARPIPS